MTDMQKLTMLKTMSELTDSDAVLSSYLVLAGEVIIARCYPFRSDVTEVPAKYHTKQVEIAIYLLNKRGAEGETSHNENGINRFYESASVPDSMLKDVIPFAEVL